MPEELAMKVGAVVGGSADENAIIVVGVALGLGEALLAARGAAFEV
jgi:hypothetical protein